MKRISKGVVVDSRVRFGKPVIEGTRVPVELVVGKVASGADIKEISKEYNLTKKQILNALSYAAELVSSEEVQVHESSYR